eukprot:PhF_6_TR36059/c0_g1_i1/m.52333
MVCSCHPLSTTTPSYLRIIIIIIPVAPKSFFSANSLSPQAMSSECVSMERNSSDPSLSPQVIVPQTDVENAHQQLTNLQTYATQRGVPGESFRTLEVELQAIAEGKDGKGALEMDEWWRRLAL